jgi:hypothetical protein
MHPLSLVDNEHFITLVKELDPRINLSCRTTLTNVLLPKLYEEAKTKLREELASVNHVALTTDGWTPNTGDSYITVTVHYINSHLKMITRVLNTSFVPQAHTSENICAFLKEVANEWNIDEKIVAIVTDNASNMKLAVTLGGWKHVPDRNFRPKAGPMPCGWCGGHRGISKMSHCEPLFECVTHFSSCRIRHFLLPLVQVSDASRFYFLAPS